jgi:hypothetical protein
MLSMKIWSPVTFAMLVFPVAVAAADVAYTGPAGWSHVESPPSTDTTRKVEQWHIAGDVGSVTYTQDSATAYADTLSAIEANFKKNNIKPATDKDMPCQGKIGHVVEFTFGPDGHKIVINNLLVPNGAGVDKIVYAREDGSQFDPDVKKSETAYCAAPPS